MRRTKRTMRQQGTLGFLTVLVGLPWLGSCAEYQALPANLGEVDFARHAKAFFAKYCYECHGSKTQKAEVNLEVFQDAPRMYEQRGFWEGVRKMLQNREMPPEKKAQPSEADRKQMVLFIDKELAKFDCDGPVPAGRVTIRRLNRTEYNNTIRDLLAVDFQPAKDFPLDEVGYGFDNIGDVLSLSPMLVEKYLAAAEDIVTRAVVTDYSGLMPRRRVAATAFNNFGSPDVRVEDGQILGFFREGKAAAEVEFPASGKYVLRVHGFGDQAGTEPPKLSVKLDGRELAVLEVKATDNQPVDYDLPVQADAGKQTVEIAFLNNFNANGDRNVYVKHLELVGPTDGPMPDPPESHKRLIPRKPAPAEEKAAAREYLESFASRAFRRPATKEEVRRLTEFVDLARKEGGSFEQGMQLAAQAVLVSPQFLFRWELDNRARNSGSRQLNGYELASRLSYFLWSSLPDNELTLHAAKNDLHKLPVLEAQVKRMLADPKAWALVENFAGQWLQVRNLELSPDPKLFPNFDQELGRAMKQETLLFVQAVMKEDRRLMDLLDSDFTFVNERLAKHYGMPGVQGPEFRRIRLAPDTHRVGVLTHASILAQSSSPTRTSPVNRGKWILEQILGAPPPPPPPNVPELDSQTNVDLNASLRKRMEQHRANPECATCHEKMDSLGFAFENFDAIGAWREMDGADPVDSSGTLPDGRSFKGPAELIRLLKQDDGFARTVTEKMLTFALGRGLEYYDKCAVDVILEALEKHDYRFSTLVMEIVRSQPFQKRQLVQEES